MSCQITPRLSSALALTEFHSLSPPCDHSAETPGPLIPQPRAFAAGRPSHEGFKTGSCRTSSVMPRIFSASYQRYSDAGVGGRGDACSRDAETRGRGDEGNSEGVRRAHSTIKTNNQRRLMKAFLWSIVQAAHSYARVEQLFQRKWYLALSIQFQT